MSKTEVLLSDEAQAPQLPISSVPVTGEIVDKDAIEIGQLYQKAGHSLVDSVKYQIECGQRLTEKKATMKHGQWVAWLQNNMGVLGFKTDRTAQRLMKIAKANTTPASDLSAVEALQISRQAWGHMPANYSSETNEWYTPADYMQTVRGFLGEVDLDPASNTTANETVQAKEIYTANDNGLARPWNGRVFVNPPYGTENGQSVAGQFCAKAIQEYNTRTASEVIILVNSVHSQKWQAPLYDYAVCFVDHRIKFVNGDGGLWARPVRRVLVPTSRRRDAVDASVVVSRTFRRTRACPCRAGSALLPEGRTRPANLGPSRCVTASSQ